MHGFLVALGFLTRIPVPASAYADVRARSLALAWYPLVGGLLGGLLVALAWCLRGAEPLLRAALLVVAWVALTGALHLDGLADSADAWVGGMGSRKRTLAIMHDPRSGPVGVTALVLVLLVKFTALASSLPISVWPVLVLAPVLARAATVALFLTTPYVRPGGLGDALQQAPRGACWLVVALAIGACGAIGWRGGFALIAAALVFTGWRFACRRRLGGFTGDTAGALIELVEAAVLVASVLV